MTLDDYTPADIVADIENHGVNLNDWERKFVSDIARKLEKGWTLTEKQIEKLKAIHEDRVG